MREWIYIMTPQHTGTWFAIAFFCNHPAVNGLTEVNSMPALLAGGEPREYKLRSRKKLFVEGLGTVNVIHSHIRANPPRETLLDFQVAMMTVCAPVVITLRDPLLALTTMKYRWSRRKKGDLVPSLDHLRHCLDVWVYMIEVLQKTPCLNPIYLPLDLLTMSDQSTRHQTLFWALERLGLEPEPHASEWAKNWPLTFNSSGPHEAKDKYSEGDSDYFKTVHSDVWGLLQQDEAVLRPFLNQQGYEGLMWFT